MPRKKARTKRSFGRVEQLPSGRYRARYLAPDGTNVKAPHTFATKIDAEGWLSDERRLIDLEVWTHPEAREKRKEADSKTFSELFDEWLPLDGRKETTQIAYTSVYNNRVKAYLGDRPILSQETYIERTSNKA